ncbi:MAG: NADH-quinone oxidoreductase subunit I, partial [Anaerolineae bacterium]
VGLRPERRFISCTLCGICAQVCRPDALCLVQDEGEIELVFDPACCDGCGYCVKYCPERILRVWETAVNGHHPRQEQLAASTIVPCAGCGTPLAAEAMLNRILERFRRQQGDPADEAAMYLCHVCKVGAAAVT